MSSVSNISCFRAVKCCSSEDARHKGSKRYAFLNKTYSWNLGKHLICMSRYSSDGQFMWAAPLRKGCNISYGCRENAGHLLNSGQACNYESMPLSFSDALWDPGHCSVRLFSIFRDPYLPEDLQVRMERSHFYFWFNDHHLFLSCVLDFDHTGMSSVVFFVHFISQPLQLASMLWLRLFILCNSFVDCDLFHYISLFN